MARKQAVTIQDTVETNDEFERYLLDNRDKLICMEVYSEFCGYCLAAGNAVKKIKLEIGGDRVSMVKAVADNITSLVRFKDKSEPVFLFISGGKLTRAVFGANAIELCQVAEEELGIQAKELETGVPRAQPIREVHEMLPEEASSGQVAEEELGIQARELETGEPRAQPVREVHEMLPEEAENAIELCQVAEEELGIQARELETGEPRAQPVREVHEMLPEEAVSTLEIMYAKQNGGYREFGARSFRNRRIASAEWARENALELCQVAEEELGIQAKEVETGVPRAQPVREVHEMLPEEAEKMEADLQAEKEYLEEIERARLQTMYERKRRVNERLASSVLTLNYILFWPHCHHAHYDLYEKWDTINVTVAGKETLQLTKDDLDEVFYQSDILPNEACIHALLDGEAMVVLFKMPDGDDRDFVQVMRKALYEETPARKDDVPLDKQPPPVPAYERYATVSKSKREVRRDRYNEKMRKLQEEKEERERLAAERARLAKQAEDDRIAEEKRRKEEERFAQDPGWGQCYALPADPEPEEPPPTEGTGGEEEKKEGEEDKKEGEGDKKEGEGDKKEGEGDKKEGEGDKKEGEEVKKEGEEVKKEGEEVKKEGEVNKQEGDERKKDTDDATNTDATVTDTEGRSERTETTAGTESVAATDVTEGTEPTTVATETTAAPSEGEQPQPNPEDPEPEPLEEILQEFHSDVSIEGEEYIPPPGLFIPGLYTPGNHLARANGLAFFYPKYISRIAPIESEKLPPHVLVMFPVERRAELQDLLETYKDEILNIGVFAVENDLSQAEHVAYSIRQYNKMDRPMKHKECVALMVSAARSLPLLQLGARGPGYVSGDAGAGERDCLRMFSIYTVYASSKERVALMVSAARSLPLLQLGARGPGYVSGDAGAGERDCLRMLLLMTAIVV
ncbi:unnamed protein product [Plutella xylostella]|uniref:(diamondback moth) hypothetical protein n=1 Tax=Plutella xylostella TaxID=51655 RepID=A0A8S4GCJ8_PLUXY|nr:unnamed protein product [Plutella xylostella]